MAIPFYENEEELQQQHAVTEEIDQVDGPTVHSQNIAPNQNFNSPYGEANHQNLMAWKVLALAMCKALKDHYHQNMQNSNSTHSTNSSSSSTELSTAVIQILPNGQVKPQWN